MGWRSGGGGYEGETRFVYAKWASHFWIPIQESFLPRGKFFWFRRGRWVGLGRVEGGGGGRQITPPPAPWLSIPLAMISPPSKTKQFTEIH